jgi:hypothetical protein
MGSNFLSSGAYRTRLVGNHNLRAMFGPSGAVQYYNQTGFIAAGTNLAPPVIPSALEACPDETRRALCFRLRFDTAGNDALVVKFSVLATGVDFGTRIQFIPGKWYSFVMEFPPLENINRNVPAGPWVWSGAAMQLYTAAYAANISYQTEGWIWTTQSYLGGDVRW